MNRADRHELERNELADRIESGLATVQPAMPAVLGGIALIIVGSIIYGLYSTSVSGRESAAWTEYYFNLAGSDSESFMEVAESFPSSSMAGWARLSAADKYLYSGVEALYTNRKEGEETLRNAIDAYQEVVDMGGPDELKAKALMGLAKAHESLGEVEEASEFYQQYTSSTAPPEMISMVNDRLAFLNSKTGKEFYDWFNKQEPKPDSAISLPGDLTVPPTDPDIGFGPTSGLPMLGDEAEIDPEGLPKLDLSPSSQDDGEPTNPEAGGEDKPSESPSEEAAEAPTNSEENPSSEAPEKTEQPTSAGKDSPNTQADGSVPAGTDDDS